MRYPVTRYLYRPVSLPVATLLARSAVTPTQVTLVSAAIVFAGAAAFASGRYVLGAAATLAGIITDCVDGDLARLTDRKSRSGAFLDSVLDRWTDAAVILGLGLSDIERLGPLAALAAAASLITSYTRARAQSLGSDCPEGLAGRDARMLIIVIGAAFGFALQALALVAALSLVTAGHRMLIAHVNLKRIDETDRLPTT